MDCIKVILNKTSSYTGNNNTKGVEKYLYKIKHKTYYTSISKVSITRQARKNIFLCEASMECDKWTLNCFGNSNSYP